MSFIFYTFEGEGKFAGMVIVDSFLDNEDDEKTLADNATLGANCCKKVNKQLTGSKTNSCPEVTLPDQCTIGILYWFYQNWHQYHLNQWHGVGTIP